MRNSTKISSLLSKYKEIELVADHLLKSGDPDGEKIAYFNSGGSLLNKGIVLPKFLKSKQEKLFLVNENFIFDTTTNVVWNRKVENKLYNFYDILKLSESQVEWRMPNGEESKSLGSFLLKNNEDFFSIEGKSTKDFLIPTCPSFTCWLNDRSYNKPLELNSFLVYNLRRISLFLTNKYNKNVKLYFTNDSCSVSAKKPVYKTFSKEKIFEKLNIPNRMYHIIKVR